LAAQIKANAARKEPIQVFQSGIVSRSNPRDEFVPIHTAGDGFGVIELVIASGVGAGGVGRLGSGIRGT
jgi:hypothetical protein